VSIDLYLDVPGEAVRALVHFKVGDVKRYSREEP
jgi:hypothetical protein